MDGEVITLALAKSHLRVTSTAEDTLLGVYIHQAERALFDYLGLADLAAFYYEHGESNGAVLQLAVLVALTELYDKRNSEPLTAAVKAIVRRFRNPVISTTEDAE